MVSEPNEDRARELLARAAASIDVDGDAPLTLTGLPEPTHRRWPVVLAVAAVVVLLAGVGYVAATQAGDEPAPPVASSDVTSDLPTAPAIRADQIPPLLGYTGEEAEEVLRELGLAVEVREQGTICKPDGMLLGSDPAPGTRFTKGDVVTIRVSRARGVIDCIGEPDWALGWDLLRYARGLAGPPERIADDLAVRGPDGSPASLERAMAELAVAAQALDGVNGVYSSPSLAMGRQAGSCLESLNPAAIQLWFEVPVDGIYCPSFRLILSKDDHGRLAALDWMAPDVVEPDETEPDPRRDGAGKAFASWARRTGPAPEFADEVRMLIGDHEWKTLDGGRAAARKAWTPGCPRFMSNPCDADRMSPLGVIASDWHPVVRTLRPDGRSEYCSPDGGGELPADLEAAVAEDMVELSQPEPKGCGDAYRVELWVDGAGAIYAVNLAISPRKGPLPRP